MRMAVIEGTLVVNVIEAEADFKLPGLELVPANPDTGVGYTYAGGEFSRPNAPPAVPTSASAAQCLMALYDAGLLNDVRALVAAHPYEPVRIWFENAGSWERDHAYISAIALEMGLTDAQVDDLFRAAVLKG